MSISSDFARVSAEQAGLTWPVLFVDSDTLEVIRAGGDIAAGEILVHFHFGEVKVLVPARIRSVAASPIGQRARIEPDDEKLWAYCLKTTRSPVLDVSELVANTPPGVRVPSQAVALRAGFLRRSWPQIAAAVLAMIVGLLTYDRFFFASAARASVATDEVYLSAPGNGRVIFVTSQNRVHAGEPVAGLARSRSREHALESPCDCIVTRRFAAKGSWVVKADAIVGLSHVDARRFVQAAFPAADVPQLLRGTPLTFRFQNGITSRIAVPPRTIIETSKPAASGLVEINLDPGIDIPAHLLGEPVQITYSVMPEMVTNFVEAVGLNK